MEDRPRIGVTTGTHRDWLAGGSSYEPYAVAVREAGGEPVRLDAAGVGRQRPLMRELHGLLLTGGWDVDLRLYPRPPAFGEARLGELMARRGMRIEPERDRYEIPLALAALEADRPVLGICRGCQLINVALGGQLILDIETEVGSPVRHPSFPEPARLSAYHALAIDPASRLAATLPPDRFRRANSRHHQAVRPDTQAPVKAAAFCPEDGIIEAIEGRHHCWVLGVQWHPEHPKDPEIRETHRPLFGAFIAACR